MLTFSQGLSFIQDYILKIYWILYALNTTQINCPLRWLTSCKIYYVRLSPRKSHCIIFLHFKRTRRQIYLDKESMFIIFHINQDMVNVFNYIHIKSNSSLYKKNTETWLFVQNYSFYGFMVIFLSYHEYVCSKIQKPKW